MERGLRVSTWPKGLDDLHFADFAILELQLGNFPLQLHYQQRLRLRLQLRLRLRLRVRLPTRALFPALSRFLFLSVRDTGTGTGGQNPKCLWLFCL